MYNVCVRCASMDLMGRREGYTQAFLEETSIPSVRSYPAILSVLTLFTSQTVCSVIWENADMCDGMPGMRERRERVCV